jgi:hypothetical protein
LENSGGKCNLIILSPVNSKVNILLYFSIKAFFFPQYPFTASFGVLSSPLQRYLGVDPPVPHQPFTATQFGS